MNTKTMMKKPLSPLICASLLLLLSAAGAPGQNVLAQIRIPSTSGEGALAVNPALNLLYASGGFDPLGGSLTVIDGHTFNVVTTIRNLNGVAVDTGTDNFWTSNLYGGQVLTYSSSNVRIFAKSVGSGYCPGETSFDCNLRRMWAAAQCGAGNDPVFAFDADTFALIAGPVGTGGVMGPIIANPLTGKLYVTASGVSKKVNPITFAVTNTSFGTVEAVNSVTNRLFAVQDNNFQIINGANDTVLTTVPLGYSPAAMGVNNALGHVYLAYPAGNRIQVRAQNGNLLGTFSLGAGNQPTKFAVDSIRGRLYVGVFNGTSWSVWVIEDLVSARTCGREGGS